jgi:hypothetical protein
MDAVDIFTTLYLQSQDWEDFLKKYLLYQPGAVGRMFDSYRPATTMRYEDLPWSAVEFVQSYGVQNTAYFEKRPAAPAFVWDGPENLRTAVMRAEHDFCIRYDYY